MSCPGPIPSSDLFNQVNLGLFSYPDVSFSTSMLRLTYFFLSIFVCAATSVFFAWLMSAHAFPPYVMYRSITKHQNTLHDLTQILFFFYYPRTHYFQASEQPCSRLLANGKTVIAIAAALAGPLPLVLNQHYEMSVSIKTRAEQLSPSTITFGRSALPQIIQFTAYLMTMLAMTTTARSFKVLAKADDICNH